MATKQHPRKKLDSNCDIESLRTYKPEDFSDVGQAKILVEACKDRLCYAEATDYLYYDGTRWAEDKLAAQKLVQDLTELQLQAARIR